MTTRAFIHISKCDFLEFADGVFLVSAELKNENVTSLRIKSIKDRICNVECDGIKGVVIEFDKKEIPFTRNGNTVSFETQAYESYIFI